jgi:hypothetical protein
MLPNVYASPAVVLFGELRSKHDRIQDLNAVRDSLPCMTNTMRIGGEGWRTAERLDIIDMRIVKVVESGGVAVVYNDWHSRWLVRVRPAICLNP